jgi:hypothetical protein
MFGKNISVLLTHKYKQPKELNQVGPNIHIGKVENIDVGKNASCETLANRNNNQPCPKRSVFFGTMHMQQPGGVS